MLLQREKSLRKTLLYQQFRGMNKRNSSVTTIVTTIFHFQFFIFNLQIVYFSSAVLWFYLIQTKQEWMDITFAHQEKDSCGNKASWPWQWVNKSWVWILLRKFIIRPEKCGYIRSCKENLISKILVVNNHTIVRDIYIECSKQFKWNSYFAVLGSTKTALRFKYEIWIG